MNIIGSEIEGNEALLKAKGLRDGEKSTGSIELKLEDGPRRVFNDSRKVKLIDSELKRSVKLK